MAEYSETKKLKTFFHTIFQKKNSDVVKIGMENLSEHRGPKYKLLKYLQIQFE